MMNLIESKVLLKKRKERKQGVLKLFIKVIEFEEFFHIKS